MVREKILIVDDQGDVVELIHQYLNHEGFKIISTGNAEDAFLQFCSEQPDLIILDMLLPDMDGIEFCKKLRKVTSVPIIFLSSKVNEIDKILALGVGGDDYLTKPFSLLELVARVKVHLRRNVSCHVFPLDEPFQSLKYHDLEIDPSTHSVSVDHRAINLTAKEFKLLHHFALNPNRIYNNDQLFNLIWGAESIGDTRTVMVHISNLRKKIEKDHTNPKFITTIRGVGYKFKA